MRYIYAIAVVLVLCFCTAARYTSQYVPRLPVVAGGGGGGGSQYPYTNTIPWLVDCPMNSNFVNNTLTDISGNNHGLTNNAGVTFIADMFTNSLGRVDGVHYFGGDDKLQILNSAAGGLMTNTVYHVIRFWYWMESSAAVATFSSRSTGHYMFDYHDGSTVSHRDQICGWANAGDTNALVTNRWHSFMVTVTNNADNTWGVKRRVDGVLRTQDASSYAGAFSMDIIFNVGYDAAGYWKGYIRNLQVGTNVQGAIADYSSWTNYTHPTNYLRYF